MIFFIKQNWLLIISLIYVLSPIDIIPEFLVGPLGLLDDIVLIIALLIFRAIKHKSNNGDSK